MAGADAGLALDLDAGLDLVLRLQALSEDMLGLAEAGQWDAVAERELARQDIMRMLSARALPAATQAAVASCLQNAIAANDALLALGRARREQLGETLRSLGAGRRACGVYASVEDNGARR